MLGWELPPHNSGGLGVACYHMSKALALEGASIDFIVPYSASHAGADFMKVHAALDLGPLHRYGKFGAYDSRVVSADDHDVSTIRGVQRAYGQFVEEFIEDNLPDAIHAHDWLTMEAGIKAKEQTGAPLVVHVHATEFDRAGGMSGNPIVHEIEYLGLTAADRIIAVSEYTKNIIVKKYGIPADKIEVVYNALDMPSLEQYEYDRRTFHYLEALKQEGYTVVAVVTRLTVQKGLTQFIQAAARACERYHKLVFLIAGSGEQRDELVSLSAQVGIADKVFFTGFVRGQQWRDAYGIADIFVMSSVSEPFGLAALEAAHHDASVIITRQSGVGEVLHSVFRYDFWDIDALADRLVGIATSPALSQTLRQNVHSEYATLNWADAAKKCMRMYHIVRQRALT